MGRDRPGIPEEVPSPDELLVDWLGDVADDDFLADFPGTSKTPARPLSWPSSTTPTARP